MLEGVFFGYDGTVPLVAVAIMGLWLWRRYKAWKKRKDPNAKPEPHPSWVSWQRSQPVMRIAITYWEGIRDILWAEPSTRPCVQRVTALLNQMTVSLDTFDRLDEVKKDILWHNKQKTLDRFEHHIRDSRTLLDERVRTQLRQVKDIYHNLIELSTHRDRLEVAEVEQALSIQRLELNLRNERSKDVVEAEEELIKELESATQTST